MIGVMFEGALIALGCTAREASAGLARVQPRAFSPFPEEQAAVLLEIRDELFAARPVQ